MAASRIVAGNKIREMLWSEWVGAQGKIHVGAQVVDPEALGLRVEAGLALIKEEHIGFNTLSVKDAGGQAQHRVHIAGLQEVAPDGLACTTLKEYVVWYDNCRAAIALE